MPIIVTYKCEKCGKEGIRDPKGHVQFWYVGYGIHHANASGSALIGKQLWCRECCEKLGIIPLNELKNKPEQVKKLTIEDRLIEILGELGFYQSE
jgi:hypothetical protein